MQATVHLHRGDGHKATVRDVEGSQWLSIEDEADNEFVIFLRTELVADAKAFAESINTLCQRRHGIGAA